MLIKKLFCVVFFLILFTVPAYSAAESNVEISAESAVVINADTGEIIYSKKPFMTKSMASTTKIMTSLIAVESGLLSQKVTVQDKILSEGTSIGLKEGNMLTLEALVYGMMLESGNDAAEITAEFFSGSEERFSDLMNKKAYSIGMFNTNFVTASGLDSDEHYSTAYDMALLGAYAVKNQVFRQFSSTDKKTVEFIEPQHKVTFSNHNKLLDSCEGVFGIKTGFTKKSGRCLVSACERNDITLVAVTLNAPNDWNDHKKLYDACFSTLEVKEITFDIPAEIQIYGSECKTASIKTDSDLYRYAYINEKDVEILTLIPEVIYAPIRIGDVLGEVRVISEGKTVYCSDITASEEVSSLVGTEYKKSFAQKIRLLLNKLKS